MDPIVLEGLFYIGIMVIFFFYILPGAVAITIVFKRWYKYERFPRGAIATPIAFLTGVCLWPVILRKLHQDEKAKILLAGLINHSG